MRFVYGTQTGILEGLRRFQVHSIEIMPHLMHWHLALPDPPTKIVMMHDDAAGLKSFKKDNAPNTDVVTCHAEDLKPNRMLGIALGNSKKKRWEWR